MSKGDRTRRRIIAEAAPLFNQKGFAGCSMQDVMEATGLEKGGLYRHFQSKEELAAAVFRYSRDRVLQARSEGLDKVEGAGARLKWYIHRFVETPGPVAGGCPIFNTAVDADDGNPTLRKLVRGALLKWKRQIAGIIEEGVERGEIRQEVRPGQMAESMIAALEGGIVLSRMEGSRDPLRSVEEALRVVIDAAAAPARS